MNINHNQDVLSASQSLVPNPGTEKPQAKPLPETPSSKISRVANLGPEKLQEKPLQDVPASKFSKVNGTGNLSRKANKVVKKFFGSGKIKPKPVKLPFPCTFGMESLAHFYYSHGKNKIVSKVASLFTPASLMSIAPVHNDMSNHVYKIGRACNMKGQEIGVLNYVGDVPVLKITATSNYDAGYAQGYLLADAIKAVKGKADKALNSIMGKPEDFASALAKIKSAMPPKFVEEMEGLVDGYNKKIGSLLGEKLLTFNEILYLHLVPDSVHTKLEKDKPLQQPAATSNSVQGGKINPTALPAASCTFVAQKDESHGLVFARNMDWMSFNAAGTYSLIVSRYNPENDLRTMEISVPGIIGTLTGMNDRGLSALMNVCQNSNTHPSDHGYIPACIFTRMVLENSADMASARAVIDANAKEPFGPFHLSVADEREASTFSLFQGNNENVHRERRACDCGETIITTNRRYEENADASHMFYSEEREANIRAYLGSSQNKGRDVVDVLTEVLALDHVSNMLTTHSVVMIPKEREMRVAFDNAWAGDKPKHTVSMQDVDSLK